MPRRHGVGRPTTASAATCAICAPNSTSGQQDREGPRPRTTIPGNARVSGAPNPRDRHLIDPAVGVIAIRLEVLPAPRGALRIGEPFFEPSTKEHALLSPPSLA